MANEIDVKDVGDVSSLSDTDKFQILVNNLLKNIPAKTLYSLLASKIPTATDSANGLMKASDRNFVPASFNVRNYYLFKSLEADTFLKVVLSVSNHINITLSAGWNNGNTTGQIIKSVSNSGLNSASSFVIGANTNTANLIYISDIRIDEEEPYFYIANKSGKRDLYINLSFTRGSLIRYEEIKQPSGFSTSLNNYTDYKNQK